MSEDDGARLEECGGGRKPTPHCHVCHIVCGWPMLSPGKMKALSLSLYGNKKWSPFPSSTEMLSLLLIIKDTSRSSQSHSSSEPLPSFKSEREKQEGEGDPFHTLLRARQIGLRDVGRATREGIHMGFAGVGWVALTIPTLLERRWRRRHSLPRHCSTLPLEISARLCVPNLWFGGGRGERAKVIL